MSKSSVSPLTRSELIVIRDGNRRNEDIRKLLLEIRRQHDVILRLAENFKVINKSWHEEVGGQLAALHFVKLLLSEEVGRFEGDV